MKLYLSLCLALSPGLLFSQIGREFVHKKLKGNVAEVRTKTYLPVSLDENGMPILDSDPGSVSVEFYKDGYPIELQSIEMEDGKEGWNVRILVERTGADIRKAAIYTRFLQKENLLREHEAFYVDGKLALENITDERRKLLGTAKYKQGKTASGNDFSLMEADGNRGGLYFIYREFDALGDVLTVEYTPRDTQKITKRLQMQGDTLEKVLILNQKRNGGASRDSALTTLRHWRDAQGNAVLTLQSIRPLTDFDGDGAVSKTMHVATAHEYRYGDAPDKPAPKFPTMDDLAGGWRSERDNVQLILGAPDAGQKQMFACYDWKKLPADRLMEVEDGWKTQLTRALMPGTWTYDAATGRLDLTYPDGQTLALQAKMEWKTLVLLPLNAKDDKPLRLVKEK